jgi:TfoX/Sxy family transcriptional regulator of competence genes
MMPKFEKTSEKVLRIFDDLTAGIDAEHRKMFGYPCLFVGGNMMCGTFSENLFFRIKVEEQDSVKKDKTVKDFEPLPGRRMKEYVSVDATRAGMPLMKKLLKKSLDYTGSLPPKKKSVQKSHKKYHGL